jgi:hypothetical protein
LIGFAAKVRQRQAISFTTLRFMGATCNEDYEFEDFWITFVG